MTLHLFKLVSKLAITFSAISILSISTTVYSDQPSLSKDEEKTIQDKFSAAANEPGALLFTPPSGWHVADPKALPPSVKIMVVGKGAREFPPSINIGSEKFSGSLKQYLKRVKEINASRNYVWKDLGKIRTDAGEASLSQVDTQTEWGAVRMMHVIIKKDDTIYIATATSLKEEFPQFYKDFFASLKSIHFN